MARSFQRPALTFKVDLSFTLLCLMLATLWLAGGASRADVLGQIVVRSVAWLSLIVLALAGSRPTLGQARPVALLLLATIALPLIQLIPLPPGLWDSLPGRSGLAAVTPLSGIPAPWRPISLVPGATLNALFSLIVPLAIFLLITSLDERERARLPGILLGLVVASMIVGLAQFSGISFNNPFINETAGRVNGTFANPNHFALFLAIGCLLAPAWALGGKRRPGWRVAVALGLLPLFVLTILASGSRAGILLGVIGTCLGLLLEQSAIRRMTRNYPRWVLPALIFGILATLAAFVFVSVAADRAQSINRLFAGDTGQDMRARGFPTVVAMIREYFPIGTGLGSFDPIFRLHEPFGLLKILYFNHAHDDFLEIILDTGLAGGLLLVAACGWWAVRSIRIWTGSGDTTGRTPAKLGSAMLLLVLVASVVDYPARTPTIMAMVMLAALFLSAPIPRKPA